MGFLLRRGVKKKRLFEKKRKKFMLFTPQKTVNGTFENGPPPQQQQQQEEEQRFPLPDLSAAPQIKMFCRGGRGGERERKEILCAKGLNDISHASILLPFACAECTSRQDVHAVSGM